MSQMNKFRLGFLFFILSALILTACSSLSGPEAVVDRYIKAVQNNDLTELQEVVDPEYLIQEFTGANFSAGLHALVEIAGGSSEIIEMEMTTVSNDGERAVVQLTGKTTATLFGISSTDSFRERIYLVNKQGRWYVTRR